MTDKKVIAIAGGGSTYTPGIITALLDHNDRLPIREVRLYDIDAVRNENMRLIIDLLLKQKGFDEVQLIVTENPEVAFTGVDFVFSQIRVGGLKMRELDEKIPLKYGLIGQETCGLGGFSYGLRSIKGLLEVVEFVQMYAPDAWILNYTNPESLITEAINRKYPNINMINVCDMTISIEETIAHNYGYNHKDWVPVYYGLNHFGWYKEIYDKSLKRDIMPEIIEKMLGQEIENEDLEASWQQTFKNMSKMLRHFPDYLPNNYFEYYLFPDMVLEHTDKNYTRANMVMDGREARNTRMAERIRNGETEGVLNFDFGEHGNYIVDIATSILNDEHRRFMLIVPNRGAIPNFRSDAVVEVPAYVGATGVEPIALDPIDDFHKGLMEVQVAAEKLLVDAYFEKSYLKALKAFTLNQTVPSARVAKQILDEMIIANKGYWPELK
ncbi:MULTISPECIES: family 4 glycosyl hydrolase [Bacillaceae]|uniref:family 4 glycosyl hydrolase n=1 Tax=Bacillaceae TaxID=186817 RepID=UPI0011A2FA8A|nr:maltose-6'-phosphate glucosidase [Virgibacillus sp. SK37]